MGGNDRRAWADCCIHRGFGDHAHLLDLGGDLVIGMEGRLTALPGRLPNEDGAEQAGWTVIRHPREKSSLLSGERGAGLVESLIALAILAIAVTPFLAAFSTGSLAVGKADRQVTAEILARSQTEYTKSQAYVVAPASYNIITPLPAGYSISSNATSASGRDTNIQKITVTVQHDGKDLVVLEDFKLNR